MPKAAAKQKPLPKTTAACADMLYKTREARHCVQKEVDALQSLETRLKDYLIAALPKGEASGVAGLVARVQITTKPIPTVDNWPKFYAYVKRTGNFDLLQKRLSEGAIKERWEAKKEIPGVGRFNAIQVSCTAIKGGK